MTQYFFLRRVLFCVHLDNILVLIWGERGTRNNPPFMLGSVRSGAVGVMVYVSADYHFVIELRPVNDLGMRSSDIL